MNLKLNKPIVFFDLETTGINIAKDKIIEISMVKIYPNGKENVKTIRLNPEIPIPTSSIAIHGITDEDVKDCPTFKKVANDIYEIFNGCDIAGYNSNKFDLPLLVEEFLRAGIDIDLSNSKLIDVQTIFHKKEQRTLSAAYKFYCGKDLNNAHSAEADTKATYEVLKSQLDKYDDLINDMDFLSNFSKNSKTVDFAGTLVYDDNSNIIVNFGKYKNSNVNDVFRINPNYVDWILKSDFPLDTKRHFSILFDKYSKNKEL